MQATRLDSHMDVETSRGDIYRIAPGPRGRGISVVPIKVAGRAGFTGAGRPGRPPNPGTVALRERLAQDSKKGNFAPTREYVAFLRRHDPGTALATARQIAYRELRAARATNGTHKPKRKQGTKN